MPQSSAKINAENQKKFESLELRFLNHLRNSQGVHITKDGLLGLDFVNKKVDIPLFTEICEVLLTPLYNGKFDIVAAPETSGFYFAPIVASVIKAYFVPIRKGSRVPKTWGKYISSDNLIISSTKIILGVILSKIPYPQIKPRRQRILDEIF